MRKFLLSAVAGFVGVVAIGQQRAGPFVPEHTPPIGGWATSATITNGTASVNCSPCQHPCLIVTNNAANGGGPYIYVATVYDQREQVMAVYEYNNGTGNLAENGTMTIRLNQARLRR